MLAAGFLVPPFGGWLFGGTAEHVGLWFKPAGRESWFAWYGTALCALALVASLSLPDTRERGYPQGTQAPGD